MSDVLAAWGTRDARNDRGALAAAGLPADTTLQPYTAKAVAHA